MIVRGMDGAFYEIPDDKTEEYKIPPEELKEKMEAACKDSPNAPMGFAMGPSAMGPQMQTMGGPATQTPQMGPKMQLVGEPVAQQKGQLTSPTAACYSCYSCYWCYYCYCYCYYCYLILT